MIIKPRQWKLSKNVKLKINNEILHDSECVKYLGVLMDKSLTWKKHMQYINTKLAKNIDILAKLRYLHHRTPYVASITHLFRLMLPIAIGAEPVLQYLTL